MRELEYPFDSEFILKKSKKIKKTLLDDQSTRIHKNIAVLGGSTTHDIIRILDLFLLHYGIEASFYESEFGQYYQDAMFDNDKLKKFAPDVIFIHTSSRNIFTYPELSEDEEKILRLQEQQYAHFENMWETLSRTYHCPLIQNNFEYPGYRLMGNGEASDIHGRIRFLSGLNERFYQYANRHDSFHIHDINYLSACYGLDKWADPFYWHMYKYALSMLAVPEFAFSLSHIIKAILGKNKKALVLDLDNTLWGGVVGDDGADNLEIGSETSMGQVYGEFQRYIKQQKQLGVLLCVNSKNEQENALAGLNHPEGVLRPEDFLVIKANWEPKSKNIIEIAKQLQILPDSLVFVDDNPAEREIVSSQVPGVAVPDIGMPEEYIRVLDRSGYFEVTKLSGEDAKRNEMYQANMERQRQQASFTDYSEYLLSLDMKAQIREFEPVYMSRIAQLTNKSNQFNLTTRRYTQTQIEQAAASADYITLYGKLEDKFGDNGVVSVVIGHKIECELHVDLWIMSCRVLKRDMEFAMMDALVRECLGLGIIRILGSYYPTAKNAMVKDFYELQGFDNISRDNQGNTGWKMEISKNYENKNHVIRVNEEAEL